MYGTALSPPMHEDEFGIDADLVRRLLAAQFPEWGWALSLAVIALPYYERGSPAFAGLARHIIDEVLADPGTA